MHQKKKKDHELESLRIRPLLGRDKRIIQIPLGRPTRLFVDSEYLEMENDQEILKVRKQPGLFDEGIIIMGDK
jgi:hypothetical protein